MGTGSVPVVVLTTVCAQVLDIGLAVLPRSLSDCVPGPACALYERRAAAAVLGARRLLLALRGAGPHPFCSEPRAPAASSIFHLPSFLPSHAPWPRPLGLLSAPIFPNPFLMSALPRSVERFTSETQL